MSKATDVLRVLKIHNNWNLLVHFGGPADVAVDYSRPAEGRAGWGDVCKTSVFSPFDNSKLLPPKSIQRGKCREFYGKRAISVPLALDWVASEFDYRMVKSPFGGFVPYHVLKAASKAARSMQ